MIHDNRLCVGKALEPVFLFLGEFLAPWQTKKTQCEFTKGFFGKKMSKLLYHEDKHMPHVPIFTQ
jgi:hypothetical protein